MGKVCNLCRVKIDISAVLTVKSGSDHHMCNLMEIAMVNSDVYFCSKLFIYFSFSTAFINVGLVHTCLVISC